MAISLDIRIVSKLFDIGKGTIGSVERCAWSTVHSRPQGFRSGESMVQVVGLWRVDQVSSQKRIWLGPKVHDSPRDLIDLERVGSQFSSRANNFGRR